MKNLKLLLTAKGGLITAMLAVLLVAILFGTELSKRRIEQAIGKNFVAAGLLANLQVEGEKMRRFEKEMFIYVAAIDKRPAYVKQFSDAYRKLLEQTDTMLAPSGIIFTDEDRQKISKWKEAAIFYSSEFAGLARRASGSQAQFAAMSPEQRAALTVTYNHGIKEGKDRFKELLEGAEKMRVVKEGQSQEIGRELASIFSKLRWSVLLGGLFIMGCVLFTLRQKEDLLDPQVHGPSTLPARFGR